jgi:hypothetical protein
MGNGLQERLWEIESVAIEIATKSGDLTKCQEHDELMNTSGGASDSRERADALLAVGADEVAKFDRDELMETINKVVMQAPQKCPECDRAYDG